MRGWKRQKPTVNNDLKAWTQTEPIVSDDDDLTDLELWLWRDSQSNEVF